MNWIESSIEGSKLFICSGCTCTCRDAISDQEKEALGLLPDSFYCRRDFSGCLAKASPSNSVEAMDSVNSNAAKEGSDGSNCDRVFILFDIFHCSNCDDELQEHRIVYGEIIENIDQIREELNGMRQRLKKLLLRNCSTEFPPMESITSNVSHTSSGVIDDRVRGSVIKDTEIKNKENEIRKQRSMSEDKDKETADHKKELITPNVSYEWSGVIDKRVHSSVPKDIEIKHQEDDSRKQRSSSEDKIKETDDDKNESITSSVSYEWPGVIDNRVHGLVSKDTKTKQKEDDIRKQRLGSEDKAKEAADHKKDTIVANVSYESYEEINNHVHGSDFNVTEIKNQEDDIRKQRSMGEDKEKEAVNNKKESITSNISYEWSGVFENRVHDSVLNYTGIRHKESQVIDNRVHSSVLRDTKTKHKEDSITSNVSYESSWEIENRVPSSFLNDTEIKNKEESITSSVSYEWPGVIDNRVQGSFIKDTKTKQKEDDIRKQRSRSEDKAKEAADHKKELMTSKVSYESSREIDKGVHGLVLKDTEMKRKEDTIGSNVSYESYEGINNRVHGSVFNVTDIKNQEDDIRKQRSMVEDKEKEIVDNKTESITSNSSYELSGVFENPVHDSVLNITGIRHKEDDIRKQRSRSEDKTKEAADHKKELMTSKVSYESSPEIDKGVHGLVLKDTEMKKKEDDIRKQRSMGEDKEKETVDNKTESITSNISYELSGVFENPVRDSVLNVTGIRQKEDDIRKQRSRSEDKTKEAADHKKELITSKVSCESSLEIDKRVHGLVLEDIEMKKKEESIMSNISYERSGVFENRVHDSVLNDTGIRHKEESINSNVSYESSWEIDNRVHGSFFNDTEIKKKEDDIQKQRSMSEDKDKETIDHKKDDTRKQKSSRDGKTNETDYHKKDDIRKQNLRNEDKAKEAVDHKKELMTSEVSYESSREIDKGIHGLVHKDIELKQKEDGIRKQRSISEYKGKGTVDRKKESIISDVSYESSRVAYNPEDSQIKFEEDDIQNQRSRSEDKATEAFDHKKESITSTVSNESPKLIDNRVHGSVPKHTVESVTSNISYGSSEEIDNHVHVSVINAADIKNKEESITSNVPRVSSGVVDYHVHGSFLNDTAIKNKETSTFKQNTRLPGRQRLQRKEDIWPGSGEIRYGGDGSVMETEIKTDDKTRRRRQRLERGSDVSGDGLSGSVLKDAEIKLKDIQDDDIPNPWSNSNLKAKETIDDNKDYVPNPVSTSEDESEETVDDNKGTVDSSIPSNDSKSEGFEVIGEGVPEIKPKDMSSHGQKPRPRRQRLPRKGKVWPGYEVTGAGVHGSILMEIEIKHASSYNQKTRQRRQRLQRKV